MNFFAFFTFIAFAMFIVNFILIASLTNERNPSRSIKILAWVSLATWIIAGAIAAGMS